MALFLLFWHCQILLERRKSMSFEMIAIVIIAVLMVLALTVISFAILLFAISYLIQQKKKKRSK